MPNPSVTVLMTVFNGEAYLRSAISSILNQTYKNFEFLIIDDCSRDQSVAVIQSFLDSRIRLVHNDTNMGQTRSLNRGLNLAQGRYIARLDADDLAFPQWLEKNLSLLEQHPQTAVMSCRGVVIDSDNKICRILNTPVSYEEMILRSFLQSPVNHVGSIFRTDVINSVGGYDEDFKIAADFELWSNLIRRKIPLATNPDPLVAIRFHEKSVSIVERGRSDVVEITKVMARNLQAMTTQSLSLDEVQQLWKLWYATCELSSPEFSKALEQLLKAYTELKPEYRVNQEYQKAFIKQQKKILYAKRAIGYINEGELTSLRTLSTGYQKMEGPLNIFTLLWLGSWLGRPVMSRFPQLYEKYCAWSTQRQLPHDLEKDLVLKR